MKSNVQYNITILFMYYPEWKHNYLSIVLEFRMRKLTKDLGNVFFELHCNEITTKMHNIKYMLSWGRYRIDYLYLILDTNAAGDDGGTSGGNVFVFIIVYA